MRKFKRHFDVEALRGHFGDQQSLIGALLERWVLPGDSGNDEFPLRMAVRDGYLNLYVHGQSVAKLTTPTGKPRIEVHCKYAEGVKDGGKNVVSSGKTYRAFEGDVRTTDAAAIVNRWIQAAVTYAGDEKRFVEHLVAKNPNVIDLEMGLPGDDGLVSCMEKRQGKRVAPRMDLALVHLLDDGQPVIDFWEAKLANNGELRSTLPANGGTKEPHVCAQLADYTAWIRLPHRTEEVRDAFQRAGRDLGCLADLAGKQGEARELWRKLAERRPELNPVPGIVIGNYNPRCSHDTRLPAADSFQANGHRKRLEMHETGESRFSVREVDSRACPNRLLDVPLLGTRL